MKNWKWALLATAWAASLALYCSPSDAASVPAMAQTPAESIAAVFLYRSLCPESSTKIPDAMFATVNDWLGTYTAQESLHAMATAARVEAADHAKFCAVEGFVIASYLSKHPEYRQ
jgi:hypothetical protein